MLIIIRGVPGSGKTTRAKELVGRDPARWVHFENDMYYVQPDGTYRYCPGTVAEAVEWCLSNTIQALSDGKNVVVANVFLKLEHLLPYVQAANRAGVDYKIIQCDGNYKNVHGVSEERVKRMRTQFEWI